MSLTSLTRDRDNNDNVKFKNNRLSLAAVFVSNSKTFFFFFFNIFARYVSSPAFIFGATTNNNTQSDRLTGNARGSTTKFKKDVSSVTRNTIFGASNCNSVGFFSGAPLQAWSARLARFTANLTGHLDEKKMRSIS